MRRIALMTLGRPRHMSALTSKIDANTSKMGEMIVLQYNSIGGGMKWTMKETKKYVEAMASGFQEIGFQPGDSIATRLDADRPEKHCALLAAMSCGMSLVSIDPEISDPEVTRKILKDHKCRILYYDEPDIPHIQGAVPEFKTFMAYMAKPLVCRGLPKLKYFVTIALDIQPASHNFPYLLAHQGAFTPAVSEDSTLAYVDYDASGKRTDYSHADLLTNPLPYVAAVLEPKPLIYP